MLVACVMLGVFLVPVVALGVLMYWLEPAGMVQNDVENGVAHPLLSCVLQSVDCFAVLPQFWNMMRRRRQARETAQWSGSGGVRETEDESECDDPLRCVGRELGSWVLWLVANRVAGTLDGITAIFATIEEANGGNKHVQHHLADVLSAELFFTVGNAVNLLLLSDFAVLLVRARCRRQHSTAQQHELLPVVIGSKARAS